MFMWFLMQKLSKDNWNGIISKLRKQGHLFRILSKKLLLRNKRISPSLWGKYISNKISAQTSGFWILYGFKQNKMNYAEHKGKNGLP